MTEPSKNKLKGVVSLFSKEELKKYFINFIILIGAVEFFIFFISFIGNLGPDKGPFPWKAYSLAAFTAPVIIIFLLGISVAAFNRYMFEKKGNADADQTDPLQKYEQRGYAIKINSILHFMRHIPLLPGLLFLIIGAIIIYKIDTIIRFAGLAGEATIRYAMVFLAVALILATILGLVWLTINYKLRKKTLEQRYEYKTKVMKHAGLIFLDDNTVIDNKGTIVIDGNKNIIELQSLSNNDIPFLPSSAESIRKLKSPKSH